MRTARQRLGSGGQGTGPSGTHRHRSDLRIGGITVFPIPEVLRRGTRASYRYGRWLRYVLLDGDNFNARLIRDGYAHAYRRFPFSKRTEFIQLEEQARQRGIGLWNRR